MLAQLHAAAFELPLSEIRVNSEVSFLIGIISAELQMGEVGVDGLSHSNVPQAMTPRQSDEAGE